MKNLKYYKTVFETKIGQIGLPERSNRAVYAGIRFPVQVRADSTTENPIPIPKT